MLRERLDTALKEGLKAKDKCTVSTVRLILAAVKERDIAARGKSGDETHVDDMKSGTAADYGKTASRKYRDVPQRWRKTGRPVGKLKSSSASCRTDGRRRDQGGRRSDHHGNGSQRAQGNGYGNGCVARTASGRDGLRKSRGDGQGGAFLSARNRTVVGPIEPRRSTIVSADKRMDRTGKAIAGL